MEQQLRLEHYDPLLVVLSANVACNVKETGGRWKSVGLFGDDRLGWPHGLLHLAEICDLAAVNLAPIEVLHVLTSSLLESTRTKDDAGPSVKDA